MEIPAAHSPKSPSGRLIAGLIATLAIIGAYAGYTLHSVQRMRRVQSDIVERNRKASLQLIRIQSDLTALSFAMRDMLEPQETYPLAAWRGQLNRIRENLDDAVRVESKLSEGRRSPQQTTYLISSFSQFWSAAERMLKTAERGQEAEARQFIRRTLQPQQEALSALLARLLVENTEEEQRAADEVNAIYSQIERNAYLFLAASLFIVAAISAAVIRSNRVLFEQLAQASRQRSELARQLITTQESTLRAVSRDLHDEFGQILTALGAMLRRAERESPSSSFREDIQEMKSIVQETLDKIRGLSQSLQPVILEEQGLGPTIHWHISNFERQTGIAVRYQSPAAIPDLDPAVAIHIFRVLQEALSNVARHAGVNEVAVVVDASGSEIRLEVRDNGTGIPDDGPRGIGLVAMRERAELLGGKLSVTKGDMGGTVIQLTAPVEQAVSHGTLNHV